MNSLFDFHSKLPFTTGSILKADSTDFLFTGLSNENSIVESNGTSTELVSGKDETTFGDLMYGAMLTAIAIKIRTKIGRRNIFHFSFGSLDEKTTTQLRTF